jgi:hypothetical protein
MKDPNQGLQGNNGYPILKFELRQLNEALARIWNMTVKILDVPRIEKGLKRPNGTDS